MSWWRKEELLPDSGGWRELVRDRGVRLQAHWAHDFSGVSGGGLRSGTASRGLAGIDLELNLERILGWEGATIVARGQWQEGSDASAEQAGDLQVFDNLDASDRRQLAEVYLVQDLIDGRLQFVVGKVDANNLFAASEHGAAFLHSSMGFSPTIVAFPSYPDPAFSLNAVWTPLPALDLRIGIYDGALATGTPTGKRGPSTLFEHPDRLLTVGEAGLDWQTPGHRRGRAAVGLWYHSADFRRLDGGAASGTWGGYAYADQWLWRRDTGGLAAFVQLGRAEEEISEIAWHIGAGSSWYAPIAGRSEDTAGVGVSHVVVSDRAPLRESSETAWELFYTAAFSGWWTVTVDVQYIANPGANGLQDLWTMTVRNRIRF